MGGETGENTQSTSRQTPMSEVSVVEIGNSVMGIGLQLL